LLLMLALARPMQDAKLLYLFEDYSLDTDRRELRQGERLLSIEPKVFDLLALLISNREHVVSKDDLLAAIWNGRIVSDSALTSCINLARSAIGDSGKAQRFIKTLPRKGFRFVGKVREGLGRDAVLAEASMEAPRAALTLPDKPSIAVLPFTNLNSDPDQDYFADGIVGDIIAELSRFSELFVIARNSSFQYKGKAADIRQVAEDLGVRYVLEGSVRRSGDRLRISSHLIDATTGVHRWAEHYDCKLQEVFSVQDEVVRKIAAILAAHVRKAETERVRGKPPNSWQAYDYYLRAADIFASFRSSYNADDLYEARRLLHRSLVSDPSYARSYALLANTHTAEWWYGPLDRAFLNPDVLHQAYEWACKAVLLDANLPEAHACLGLVLTWKGEHTASIAGFERAVTLNTNYVDWRFGFALVYAGNSRRAIDILETYMRLDPFHPPLASFFLGLAYFMLKRYSQALPILRDFVSRAPKLHYGHVCLAATLAELGQLNEARAEAAEVMRTNANFSIAGTVRRLVAAKANEHFFDSLRKVGLPE